MNSEHNTLFSKLSILVVEDNAFTSIIICKTLKSLGITKIETAKNGKEALEKIDRSKSPDVILLDLRMPVMGGVELLSQLSNKNHAGNVILMSGAEEDAISSVAELMDSDGAVNVLGFLKKPPSKASLTALLENSFQD